jgi:predicted Zn-dependent peptidase
MFFIRAGIDKERFDFGLENIYAEIEKFVSDGITSEELNNAKSYLQGKLQMGIESSDEMSEFVGSDMLLYGETKSLEQIMADYNAVTMDQVTALLPFLAKENLYLYYIK